MAENRRYIGVEEILGIKVECKCGLSIGGTIKSLAGKTAILDNCPACGSPWASGAETEAERANHITAVRTFLSQLNTFQQRMMQPGQNYSFALQIKAEEERKEKAASR